MRLGRYAPVLLVCEKLNQPARCVHMCSTSKLNHHSHIKTLSVTTELLLLLVHACTALKASLSLSISIVVVSQPSQSFKCASSMDHQGGGGGKVVRPRANRPTPYDRPHDLPAPPADDADQSKGLFGSLYAFAITPLRAVGGLLGVVSPTCDQH